MNGVQGDIQSVGEFMRMYITRNNRELSPLFIAGESYGTFRAAGLAGYLIDRGIAFNGIVLIGTTLNLETIWSRSDDLVYELELPTYAADAWYHKKVAPDLQRKDIKSFLKEVESFATGEYAAGAEQGRRPSGGRAQGDYRQAGPLYRTRRALSRRNQSALGRIAFHAPASARPSTRPSDATTAGWRGRPR